MTGAVLRRVGAAAHALAGTVIRFGSHGAASISIATNAGCTGCTGCETRHARLAETRAAPAGATK